MRGESYLRVVRVTIRRSKVGQRIESGIRVLVTVIQGEKRKDVRSGDGL